VLKQKRLILGLAYLIIIIMKFALPVLRTLYDATMNFNNGGKILSHHHVVLGDEGISFSPSFGDNPGELVKSQTNNNVSSSPMQKQWHTTNILVQNSALLLDLLMT
jgi:hypothetical protein